MDLVHVAVGWLLCLVFVTAYLTMGYEGRWPFILCIVLGLLIALTGIIVEVVREYTR